MERDFGEVLRELREKRGLTVNQLGMYSEVSPALISKIENGKRGTPKPETIRKLAKGLKFDYDELMVLAGHVTEEKEPVKENAKEPDDEFIEYLDLELTDEEILEKLTFKVDDLTLTPEEVKEFIAFIRAKRFMGSGSASLKPPRP